jgi:hypothetical protein
MTMAKKKQQSEKPAPEQPKKIERFVQDMAVALSKEEIAQRADRAAHLHSDLEFAEEAFEVVRKEHRTKLSGIRSEIRRLSSEVREKVTSRGVECERHFLYGDRRVKDIRSDTGEVIMDRAMTEEECQRGFDFPDNSGSSGKAGGGDVDDEFGGEEGAAE